MPWQIIGHDWAVSLLRQSLGHGRLSHAYLFCGPPQVGKTTLARALAQAVNCPDPHPPCNVCPACLKIARNIHPDVQVVSGRGAAGGILIDQVRTLQREAALAPYEGRYRVLILRRMDLSQPEAANSLLKTLEEPPAHVVLVLTAADREALPSTIVSRCQCLELRTVARATIQAALERRGVATSQARLLAQLSGGRIGWALASAQDDTDLRRRQQEIDQMLALLGADRTSRLAAAWKISREPPAARRQLETWITWWRDLLLVSAGTQGGVVNTDQTEQLTALAERIALPDVWTGLAVLRETAQQLEDNVNPRLALEGLMMKLPVALSRPSLPGDER